MNFNIVKKLLISNCEKLKSMESYDYKLSDYELGLLNAYSHTLNVINLLENANSSSSDNVELA